jgi:hypothetical protein
VSEVDAGGSYNPTLQRDGMEVWYGMVGWLKYLHKSDSLSS